MKDLDARLSLSILKAYYGYPRFILIGLEWLIHGIPWLICSFFAFIYVCRQNAPKKVQYKITLLLFAILLDLLFVAVIKLAVRRARPAYNRDDQIFEAPIADKYSFPSGHTSRATMLAVLLVELMDVKSIALRLLIHAFPVILGLSRVALGRHYLSDIIGGIVLGSIEALIVLQIPVPFFFQITHYIPGIFKA